MSIVATLLSAYYSYRYSVTLQEYSTTLRLLKRYKRARIVTLRLSTAVNMPFLPSSVSIHQQLNILAATEDDARLFLTNVGILKTSMTCSYSTAMDLKPCADSKSAASIHLALFCLSENEEYPYGQCIGWI